MPAPAGYTQLRSGLWIKNVDSSGPYYVDSGSAAQPFVVAGLDPDVSAWLVRVASAGGAVSAGTRNAVNSFVLSCKAAGVWALFRRLNLCCGDFAASFVPLVNTSGSATDINVNLVSGDYSEVLGWQTDGSTKYVSTGYTPSEATGGLSCYSRTTQTTGIRLFVGCRNAANTQGYRLGNNSLVARGGWGGMVTDLVEGGLAAQGLLQISRISGTGLALYRNSVSLATYATPVVPGSADFAAYVMGLNAGGSVTSLLENGSRVAGYAVDSGMSSTQAADYYTAMQTFQTALGRQV